MGRAAPAETERWQRHLGGRVLLDCTSVRSKIVSQLACQRVSFEKGGQIVVLVLRPQPGCRRTARETYNLAGGCAADKPREFSVGAARRRRWRRRQFWRS